MDIVFDNLTAMILVFVRMGGMIFLNPIFARKNIPTQLKIGLVLAMTLLITPTLSVGHIAQFSDLDILLAMFRELFIGMACAYVFNIFYYLLFFAGDMMDVEFGMSMAKVFDPGTNVQMSVSGNFLNILFFLYVFSTDCHLLLLRLFATSYEIIPVGAASLVWNIPDFALNMFITAFSLAVRLTLPFVAAEFIVEMAMGVLMKLIPQIHVFVINIQLKLFLGLTLLLAFAGPLTTFLDNYTDFMFQNIQQILYAMGGA